MCVNPVCVVCPSVSRQPPQGRVLWPYEPSSAYCLSYRENTIRTRKTDGKERMHVCIV